MAEQMIKLIYVDSKYIKYLYNFDKRVMYNKGQKRPYIGVLFSIRGHKFYAPLTHPKEKFKTMKNDVDFMRIEGGTLGAINFNNMIPVHDTAILPIDISAVTDVKYRFLLINQIRFFNKNEISILNKASKLYNSYKHNLLRPSVKERCCDFLNLEKVSKKYNPNFKIKN